MFNFIVGDTSRCKRLVKQESWWWGYCGVPKKAQKGPLKRKKCSFFFIVTTKMNGMTSNLKWKFLINATTIMQKFVALLKWLHRKIWPQKPKIAPKKSVFLVYWPKNNILRSGYPNFFFYFANIRCLEVPKKISGHISKKWLRYDHLKRRGKNGKRRKWSFFVIFLNNWVQKGVLFILIHSWGHYKM